MSYFRRFYPSRSKMLGKWMCRHGEAKRIRILRRCIPSVEGLSLLDVGCGDGVTLAAVLSGRPRMIHLEDISIGALVEAGGRLRASADEVVTVVADLLEPQRQTFDIVLAIGILDYQADLFRALHVLLARTSRLLIVTVPTAHHPRNWIRYFWFALQGIHLQLASKDTLRRLAYGYPVMIERGPYEWFLQIHVREEPQLDGVRA